MNGKWIGGILAGGLVLLLGAAWVDGGEEPLHPIEQTIALPERAR